MIRTVVMVSCLHCVKAVIWREGGDTAEQRVEGSCTRRRCWCRGRGDLQDESLSTAIDVPTLHLNFIDILYARAGMLLLLFLTIRLETKASPRRQCSTGRILPHERPLRGWS